MEHVKELQEFDDSIVFSLPGQCEPYEDCGTIGFKGHLSDDGSLHYQSFSHSCNRFSCPVCSPNWRRQEALAISDRLAHYVKLTGGDVIHFVISPKPKSISKLEAYKNLRSQMYEVAKKVGILGGVAIFHYFRHPSSLNDRTELEPDQPHWHILGDSYHYNGFRAEHLNISAVRHLKDWVVKYVSIRKSYTQIFKTVDYALTWGSQVSCPYADLTCPKVEIETWFGIMSYSAFSCPKFIGDGIKCLTCGKIIKQKDWYWITFHDKPPPEDHGILAICDPDSPVHWHLNLTWRSEDEIGS